MNNPDQATHYLAKAHNGWEPRDAFKRGAMDRATAGIQLDLGRLQAAEQFATSALRTYRESHRRGCTMAQLLLAEVRERNGSSPWPPRWKPDPAPTTAN
jgi:hypothetical protein